MLKIRKKNREQLPVMLEFAELIEQSLNFAAQIEQELESKEFDRPELWPSIYEARSHASRLKAWLSEINWLVFEDHGEEETPAP